jgi:hypothetical protein
MGGICLAAQQGLWSFPSARQANISVSQGAQIIRSDTLASPTLFGSQNLFTHLYKQKMFRMAGEGGEFTVQRHCKKISAN